MFLNQSVKSPFINHHSALKKATTFNSVPPQQLWGNVFLTAVCSLPSANEEPDGHRATLSWIFHHLECLVPYSNLYCIFLTAIWWFFLMSSSFFLLQLTTAVLNGSAGVPLLKCCTRHETLLLPMQASPIAHWFHPWIPNVGISYLTRNFMIASCWNNLSLPAIFSHQTVATWQGLWYYFHADVKMKLGLVVIAHCNFSWHLF